MNRLKINVVTLKEDEYLIRDSIRFENCSYLQLFIDDEDITTYPDFEDILIETAYYVDNNITGKKVSLRKKAFNTNDTNNFRFNYAYCINTKFGYNRR